MILPFHILEIKRCLTDKNTQWIDLSFDLISNGSLGGGYPPPSGMKLYLTGSAPRVPYQPTFPSWSMRPWALSYSRDRTINDGLTDTK